MGPAIHCVGLRERSAIPELGLCQFVARRPARPIPEAVTIPAKEHLVTRRAIELPDAIATLPLRALKPGPDTAERHGVYSRPTRWSRFRFEDVEFDDSLPVRGGPIVESCGVLIRHIARANRLPWPLVFANLGGRTGEFVDDDALVETAGFVEPIDLGRHRAGHAAPRGFEIRSVQDHARFSGVVDAVREVLGDRVGQLPLPLDNCSRAGLPSGLLHRLWECFFSDHTSMSAGSGVRAWSWYVMSLFWSFFSSTIPSSGTCHDTRADTAASHR